MSCKSAERSRRLPVGMNRNRAGVQAVPTFQRGLITLVWEGFARKPFLASMEEKESFEPKKSMEDKPKLQRATILLETAIEP